MPEELAANEWGTITYYPPWNMLAPDGPASFPTGWFETRARLYQWLTSA